MTIAIGFMTVSPQEPMDSHGTADVTTVYISVAVGNMRWLVVCDQGCAVGESAARHRGAPALRGANHLRPASLRSPFRLSRSIIAHFHWHHGAAGFRSPTGGATMLRTTTLFTTLQSAAVTLILVG